MTDNLRCKRDDCAAEHDMRALESIRQGWLTSGERPTQAVNEYWIFCRTCQHTVGFKRSADGMVTALTRS